jgi:hypothetical protein
MVSRLGRTLLPSGSFLPRALGRPHRQVEAPFEIVGGVELSHPGREALQAVVPLRGARAPGMELPKLLWIRLERPLTPGTHLRGRTLATLFQRFEEVGIMIAQVLGNDSKHTAPTFIPLTGAL